MAEISRRAVLIAGTAAAAVTAVGIRSAHAATTGGSFVTIIAHSDDDLLFINPDIQPAILSGRPCRTIVLTSDEFNGTDDMTREELSAALQGGQRAAYASLAGVANQWNRGKITVAGKIVEVNTLVGAPHVQLVYLQIPDGGDDLHVDALTNLWNSGTYATDTILPTGSPIGRVQRYTHADVNAVLLGLLQLYQPTSVRTQDPFPDDARFGASLPEHWDHVAAAKFATRAVKAYEGPDGRPFVLCTRYRCYNTQQSPVNVPALWRNRKTAAYQKYKDVDPLTGDVFDPNLSRNYERWPVTQPWAAIDSSGMLHAFVVAGDCIMWWRQPNGGAWVGPTNLLAGTFAPGVAVVRRSDGKLQLAVLDIDTGGVRTATQTAAGGGFGTWTNLGNPNNTTPAYGTPCFGVNAEGFLELYVVNRAGTLSNKWQEGTGFSGWVTVSGGSGKAMTPPVALTAPSGRLHVFADGNGKALHWYQNPAGGTTYQALTTNAVSTHTPGATVDGANKVRVFTRRTSDGSVGTLAENTPNGTWGTTLTNIGSTGGTGHVATITSAGPSPRVFAFARNGDYGLSMTTQDVNGAFTPWQDLGGYFEVGPTAVRDAMGRVRVLVLGGDCVLHERVQSAPGPDSPLGGWQQAGS